MDPDVTPVADGSEQPDEIPPTIAGGQGDAAGPTPPRGRRFRTAIVATVIVALVGVAVIGLSVTRPWVQQPACAATAADAHPGWSIARRWDEALLDAIRRALPNPPVHARNLFHTSVAMWDAWAAYDPTASGYLVKEKHTASDVTAARMEAMSYAAYGVLTSRFIKAVGGAESVSEFADVMDTLCYPLTVKSTDGDTPAALGNRIAAAVIAYGLADGSNQAAGYASPDYKPVNPPLVVAKSGTTMVDPNRWQPLQLEHMISQNGIPVVNGVQQAVGPHWGHVMGFALPAAGRFRRTVRPGSAAATGRSGLGPGLQGPGGRGHPGQRPARSGQRPDDRHLAGRPRQQHARRQRRHGPPGQPGDRAAVRGRHGQPGRLRSRHGGVLGRRPEVRDAARPLERHRQHGVATSWTRTCGSAGPVTRSIACNGT